MPNHLFACALGLLFGAASLGSTDSASGSQPRNLDALSPAQLGAYLEADLDDIYEGHSPDELVDIDELQSEIMDALADSDDNGLESEIDFEDLEAEMEEDDTTVEDVVAEALEAIDRAEGPQQTRSTAVHASFVSGPVETLRSTRRLAVQQTKRELIRETYKVRR